MSETVTRDSFMSKKNFSQHIESIVLHNPGMSYIEAVVQYSDESDIEPEDLVQYMSDVLIEKLKRTAIDSGMIRGETYDLEELFGNDT